MVGKTLSKAIFGVCKGETMANSGLYMGYAKYLKLVIDEALSLKCEDDQVNLNTICQKYDFIKVDEDEKIFQNFTPNRKKIDTESIFVSYPGSLGFDRYTRAVVEYTQFLYIYILCLLILGLAFFPQRQKVLLPSLILFITFYTLVADKSCTFHPR